MQLLKGFSLNTLVVLTAIHGALLSSTVLGDGTTTNYLDLGISAESNQSYESAIQYYDQAIASYMDAQATGTALYHKMRCAYALNDPKSLESSFHQLNQGYSQSSTLPQAYLLYGDSLKNLEKNYKDSESTYRWVVDRYPSDNVAPEAQLHIAELWMVGLNDKLGHMDHNREIEEAQKVIDRWPNSDWAVQAKFTLADIYHNMGAKTKARAMAQNIVSTYTYSQYPSIYVETLYNLAFFDYSYDNNWDKALSEYSTIVEIYPTSATAPEALKQIARICYFKGNMDGALQATQKIIDNYPNSPAGIEAVTQVKHLEKLLTQVVLSQPNSWMELKTNKSSTNLCGPIALQYVLAHYGIQSNIEELVKISGYTIKGTSFAGLSHAAQLKGLKTVGLKTKFQDLINFPLPMLAQLNHKQKDHFITLQKIKNNKVYFADQKGESQSLSIQEFQYQWTGYALLIYPGKINNKLTFSLKGKNIVLDNAQMQSVMGGKVNDANDECFNNNGPSDPPGCTTGNCPSVGGGAIRAIGGGMGDSGTSLAVNYGNGYAFTSFPEMSIPSIRGGHSIIVSRTYSSGRGLSDKEYGNYGPETLWGTLWSINYATHLSLSFNVPAIFCVDGKGNMIEYSPQGDGTYKPTVAGLGLTNTITTSGSAFILNFQNGTQYVYDSVWYTYARLSVINYPGNIVVTCHYDDSISLDRLTSVNDPDGQAVTFGYTNGKLTSITNPWGRSVQYTYDSNSDLIQIQDPDGYSMYYDYNGHHQITAIRDSYSGSTNLYTYTYNDIGAHGIRKCNAITDVYGSIQNVAYGDWWSQTGVSFSQDINLSMQYQYDNHSYQLLNITRTNSVTTTTRKNDYNGYGNVVASYYNNPIGCNTCLIHYSYIYEPSDANFNNSRVVATFGPTLIQNDYYHDQVYNVLTTIHDALGRYFRFSYDTNRNLLSSTDPLGNQISFSYDGYTQLTSVTDQLGNIYSTLYNSSGQITTLISSANSSTYFFYDTYQNLTSLINALGQPTYYTYDTMHRVIQIKDSLGGTTKIQYYVNGLLKQRTDANNNVTNYTYDLRNRLTQITDAGNNVTQFRYNAFDKLTCVQDANGNNTYYFYDNLCGCKNSISIQYANGSSMWFYYDILGNLTTRVDNIGQKTFYAYDTLSRMISWSYENGTTGYLYYDRVSRVTSLYDPYEGMTYRQLDSLDRVTTLIKPSGTISYSYNSNSWLTGMTDPDGRNFNYSYDSEGWLTRLVNWANQSTLYSYNVLDQVTTESYPNQTKTYYFYDALGRPTSIQFYNLNVSNPSTLQVLQYAYDSVGNRTLQVDLSNNTTFYYYDTLNHLTTERRIGTDPYTRIYSYDGVENRTKMMVMTNSTTTTTYVYNNLNQLTISSTNGVETLYSYDANGNLTTKGNWFYSWDTANRLTLAINGGVMVQFNYDVFGRRTQKIIGTTTTQYVFDGELDTLNSLTNGTTNKIYTLTSGMIGQIVSVRVNGIDYFYHYDPIGNVLMITDSTGTIIANYTQEGFGNLIASFGSATNNYHLTTKEYDPDLGLYYFGARWYDPQIGRWISREPTGADGFNLYQYGFNSPLNGFDTNGLRFRYPWKIYDEAGHISDWRFTNMGQKNGIGDAFRHCLASCMVAVDDGGIISKLGGWYHETTGNLHNQPVNEYEMDTFNNALGRRFAEHSKNECDCFRKCFRAAKIGHLKTIPEGSTSPGYYNQYDKEDDY